MHSLLARFISDSNAQIRTAFGCSLAMVTDHPQIVKRIKVQTSSISEYNSHLEELFYGKTDSIVFKHPDRYLYYMEDVCVTGSEGHLFFDPKTIFAACPSLINVEEKKIRRPLGFLAHGIEDTVLILGGRAPGNRAHFLMEHLPRLVAAMEAIGKDIDFKVLVTPGQRKWQLPYFEKFDISAARVLEASATTTFCRHAFYVPLLSEGGREVVCDGRYYKAIRSFFTATNESESAPGGAVFISRQDAVTRRLINEDEIFQLTKKLFPDIERVALSRLSLAEQVELFQRSSVIIGPHGQPFRNAMFADNALIIQLIPGYNDGANEYKRWGRNFNCIGELGGNHCVSLYSGDSLVNGASHWLYNTKQLLEELARIIDLRGKLG